MGKRILIAVAAAAILAGSASTASAQLPPGWDGWKFKGGWNGSFTESAHQDEGAFSVFMGFHPFGKGYFSAGAELRIGYEFDFGGVQKYLGAVQYTDESTFKFPWYANVYAGLEHFPGDSAFYMEPAVGMVFPWGFKDFRLYGQVSVPMHFYSNSAEIGFGGQVGLTLPFRF